MTNSKTTKRALFSSVVALLLCFTMLLGTTFAWFTDSAASGVNKIIAGNLDIGVYYAYPSDVVDGDIPADAWKPVTADESLFNNDALWEPGYTEAVFLKFENEGTLALQYQLQVDILNEVLGKTKDGADIQLSKYINAYACNSFAWDYTNYLFTERDNATDPAGAPDPYYDTLYNAANGEVNTPNNENPLSMDSWQWLEPEETTYATLVLWMPTTVGNEANHDGKNIPSIDLGISVLATQYTYENDSFDDQYDKDAVYEGQPPVDAVKVDSADALLAAFATGGDVVLTSDITLSDAFDVDADTTIYGSEGATLSFTKNSTDIGGTGTLTFKNIDTYSKKEVHANGHIIFDGGDHEWGLLAVEDDAVVTIKSGNFVFKAFENGQTWTPDIILADNGTLNIEGGEITLDGHGDYSIHLGGYSKQPKNVTVNITGGTINSGVEDLFYTESAENNKDNTHVSISGGVFNLNSGKVLTDTNTWGVPGEYADGIATITGGTFFTSRSDRVAAYVADGYELVGDETNGYVVSAK